MPQRQSEGTSLRQQPRLWDSYQAKSPNLRHRQVCSQNKGLSRASRLQTGPSSARQPEPEGGNCSPRETLSTKLQAGFIANQDFLGFWMVDIHREGRSQRSAPQKRYMSSWDGAGDKTQPSTVGDCTHQAPGHLSFSDLGQAQNAGPTKSVPF